MNQILQICLFVKECCLKTLWWSRCRILGPQDGATVNKTDAMGLVVRDELRERLQPSGRRRASFQAADRMRGNADLFREVGHGITYQSPGSP
jgi:hypothetical protein